MNFRSALMNVLAHRAEPPEYPGLTLVPVPDMDALAAALPDSRVEKALRYLDAVDRLEPTPSTVRDASWALYWNVTDETGARFLPDPAVLAALRRALEAEASA